MAQESESDIESECIRELIMDGWNEIKIVKTQERGNPDRFVGQDGRGIFLEFKRPGEYPTDQQIRRMFEWQQAGFETYAVNSLDCMWHVIQHGPFQRPTHRADYTRAEFERTVAGILRKFA
jgi:hypothetical protein